MLFRERKITRTKPNVAPEQADGDTSMADADGAAENAEVEEEESYFEEDPTTEEGAVYPIQQGRVVDWSCLFALMTHVYNTLSPPFHTPILIITQPAWTAQDHETMTQFFFEKFKTPAFCLMDSALAVCYAHAISTATVVDFGYEKCDVTAVTEYLISEVGRGTALAGCGGEDMTQRLLKLLSSKTFTRDMCEQLKRSGICEILPPDTAMPGGVEVEDSNVNPAAAASTGANAPGSQGRGSVGDRAAAMGGSTAGTEGRNDEQDGEAKEGEDNEGVLDVATIVASGKTSEFLARKEKEKAEKAEKAAAKKAAQEAANAPKQAKLPNAKRVTATFHFTERRPLDEINQNGKRVLENGNQPEGEAKRPKTPEPQEPGESTNTEPNPSPNVATNGQRHDTEATALIRRDVEVGIERFQAASGGILDQIADAIHRCILSVPEISKRPELWDNLIIVGNGSKVRGKQPSSNLICMALICDSRLQGCTGGQNQQQIPHFSIQCNDIHFRTTFDLYHARCNRCEHTATAIASTEFSSWRRRQPSPHGCHHSIQPKPRSSRASAPSPGTATDAATVSATESTTSVSAFRAWPDTNEYQADQDA